MGWKPHSSYGTAASGAITGTGQPLEVTDAEPLRHGRRFYRIAVIGTGEE